MKNGAWRRGRVFTWLTCCLLLSACGATNPPRLSGHLDRGTSPAAGIIPPPVTQAPVVPPPRPAPKQETYTVVVNEVPVKDLLFSLARDGKLNVDIHPGIHGHVTLNAVDQTLPQILERITKQVPMRYEINGSNVVITPDLPYWRTYHVNYVNISRDSNSEISVATRIATAGGSVTDSGDSGGGESDQQGNRSETTVRNQSSNHFWESVRRNILAILQSENTESDQNRQGSDGKAPDAGSGEESSSSTTPADGGGTASPVIVNPVSGIISVRATQHQQLQIQEFLDQVMANALRQVLIEMTIVEVELNDRYQAGVDWQRLADTNGTGTGLSVLSSLIGTNLGTPPVFSLRYNINRSSGGSISATLRLLETFGNVKVLSSPKIMALNNQTALLKVVDERVYFTVVEEIQTATNTSPEFRTFTSTIHTVPVGIVMSVMPQINKNGNVTLNIRPTITRITGFVTDPAPSLTGSDFDNRVPEIQVREMESLLQVASGQTVVLGGLMQNKVDKSKRGLPLLSTLPVVGNLFSYRDDQFTKTELVIFLRPTVVKSAGLDVNLEAYRGDLPPPRTEEKSKFLGEPSLPPRGEDVS